MNKDVGSLFRGSSKSYISTKSLGEGRRTMTRRGEKYKKERRQNQLIKEIVRES